MSVAAALPLLRVRTAPDSEPAPLAAPPGPRPDTAPHRQLRLVVGSDGAPAGGAGRAPGRPDPQAFARAVCQGVVDVLAGQRAPQQMMRWLRPDVFDWLRRRASRVPTPSPGRPGRRPVVRSVRTCRVSPDAVEASAVVIDGRRARAMAVRLEGVGQRWRVTALIMG
ncbi:MAG: Rv3235 family protein [Kineosporiaceae bacterium]